jgi:hypothetical protein
VKTLLTAGAIALSVSLITASIVTVAPPRAGAHGAVEFDDLWDTGNPNRRVCRYNKRKCVEIASNLAYRMALSGAYTELDDNAFSAFAIKVAAHIVDNNYDHDEQEGPPTGAGD